MTAMKSSGGDSGAGDDKAWDLFVGTDRGPQELLVPLAVPKASWRETPWIQQCGGGLAVMAAGTVGKSLLVQVAGCTHVPALCTWHIAESTSL